MTNFTIVVKVHTADHDADVMQSFPTLLHDRFDGTAIHIDQVTVITEAEDKES